MPEPDRYIPGVPCWVDTSQPDPDAAADFYSGLFGWEFEDVMPAGAPGRYLAARLGGEDVAAVGSIPDGAPGFATWNTYIWVDSADETAAKIEAAGGAILDGAVRRHGCGSHGGVHRPRGRRVLRLAGPEAPRRPRRQPARLVELQRPEHPRRRSREAVLRRRLRLGDTNLLGQLRGLDAARVRRPSRARSAQPARGDGRNGRPRASRKSSRASTRSARTRRACRRTGASRLPWTTRTRPPRRPLSSAAACSWRRSMLRGSG